MNLETYGQKNSIEKALTQIKRLRSEEWIEIPPEGFQPLPLLLQLNSFNTQGLRLAKRPLNSPEALKEHKNHSSLAGSTNSSTPYITSFRCSAKEEHP